MTRTPPRRVTAYGAAKVNIGWRVGSKRPDGYHDVTGLIHTISLGDMIEVRTGALEGDAGITVDVEDAQLRLIVPDRSSLETADNLVVGAARALAARAAPTTTTIVLHKVIPVAAGLGGGSADAAAALAALNLAWGARQSATRLVELGAEIGSDVPAMLLGGLVFVSGRGERVRSMGAATDGAFVLGVGSEHMSASDAYAAFDELGPHASGALHYNDLEAAACSLLPGLAARVQAMQDVSGVAFVTGSGPTVVGAASSEREAEAIAERVRPSFEEVIVARPVDWGVRLVVGGDGA